MEDWNIVNISDVRTRSMHVEWSRYSLHSPFQVIVYTVVCTPTNDEVGSTLLNIKDTSIHKVDVGRLHFSTNYSVELVAFVNNSQTGEVSLRRSQKAYVVTLDPGKTCLLHIEVVRERFLFLTSDGILLS